MLEIEQWKQLCKRLCVSSNAQHNHQSKMHNLKYFQNIHCGIVKLQHACLMSGASMQLYMLKSNLLRVRLAGCSLGHSSVASGFENFRQPFVEFSTVPTWNTVILAADMEPEQLVGQAIFLKTATVQCFVRIMQYASYTGGRTKFPMKHTAGFRVTAVHRIRHMSQWDCTQTWCDGLHSIMSQRRTQDDFPQAKDSIMLGRSRSRHQTKQVPVHLDSGCIKSATKTGKMNGRMIGPSRCDGTRFTGENSAPQRSS